MFFFLTLFSQTVLGYSAVRSGISYCRSPPAS
jgi:hypothetical protein